MVTVTIRDIEIDDDAPMLLVGMGEHSDDAGLDVIFTANLRHNEYREDSNWPEGESYCVTSAEGLTSFGGYPRSNFRATPCASSSPKRRPASWNCPNVRSCFKWPPG